MNLLKADKRLDVIEKYVQRYGRYNARALKQYSVRHPIQYGDKSISANDPAELVERLAYIYKVPKEKA